MTAQGAASTVQAPAAPNVTPSGGPAMVPKVAPPFRLGMRALSSQLLYLKMLVYGPPGIGKTELLGSAIDVPEMNDVIWIDAEAGALTIQDNMRIQNWPKLIDNRIPVTTFMEVARVQEFLTSQHALHQQGRFEDMRKNEAMVRGVDVEEIKEPHIYRTVIIDSLTEIEQYNMNALMGYDPSKILTGDKDDIEVSGWPEFRRNKLMIEQTLRAFRDLPMHVLIASQQGYQQDEKKQFHYSPKVTGQLSQSVQSFMDIVGCMRIFADNSGNKEHRLYVQPVLGEKWDAKNRRSMYTKEYFAKPNMKQIMEGIGLVKPTAG